jgi:hypothetical protein
MNFLDVIKFTTLKVYFCVYNIYIGNLGLLPFSQRWILFDFFTVPLPCIVSDWSNWSAPDASGVRFRVRYMIRPALNGGKECQDLIQLGRGNI